MCIFNNNNNNNNCLPRNCYPCRPVWPRPVAPVFTSATTQYIQGPQGPQGEQGAAGAPGVSNGAYASGSVQAVAVGGTVALAYHAATDGSTVTVSNNAVQLPAGTYLVTYGAGIQGEDTTVTDVTQWQLSLYANGAAVAGETLSVATYGAMGVRAEKTILYVAAGDTALSLVNTSAATVNLTDANISVLQLTD